MRILYYDVFCGLSGDMNLGGMVDLGVDFEYLKKELDKLNIRDEFELTMKKVVKHGITGTKVDVKLLNQPDDHYDEGYWGQGENGTQDHGHDHHHGDQAHDHDHLETWHHHHDHDHQGTGHHHHDHHHHHHDYRNFQVIREMIESSDLKEKVKETAIKIFRIIAEAEGKVHGKPLDQVHFHEVGATDSIVDIVGSAICLDALGVDKVMASTVQVGGGFVSCAHGKMPVPAPATAEILKGLPVAYNIVPFETTTPTGAAILKAIVDEYTDHHELEILQVGYGSGNKDFEVPNMIRMYLAEEKKAGTLSDLEVASQWMMETNIDDMNPELYGYIEEKLFDLGALDVTKTPIIMKKGRPGTKLSILFSSENRHKLMEFVLKETSAAGVREYEVNKYMMKRNFRQVSTTYGQVTVKDLILDGQVIKSKPEYEDCRHLAKDNQVSIQDIYEAVRKEEK